MYQQNGPKYGEGSPDPAVCPPQPRAKWEGSSPASAHGTTAMALSRRALGLFAGCSTPSLGYKFTCVHEISMAACTSMSFLAYSVLAGVSKAAIRHSVMASVGAHLEVVRPRRRFGSPHLARPQKAGSSCVLYCSINLKKPSIVPVSIASAKSTLPADAHDLRCPPVLLLFGRFKFRQVSLPAE